MFKYVIGILTLQRLGLARPLRLAFLLILAVLTLTVIAYTVNLFVTLPERTSGHHVQHHFAH
jgi:hypothetical protein